MTLALTCSCTQQGEKAPPSAEAPPAEAEASAPRTETAPQAAPADVRAVLEALRKGEVPTKPPPEALSAWLDTEVVKGKTTRGEVVTLLGKPWRDLDRPERDKIVTVEYFLGPSTTDSYFLVFDFDARTDVVLDWRISHAICGFCPHVLADDGRWRLEGKLLAGCIGADAEGTDTVLLPRLRSLDGRLRVKLANWAPEIEHLDRVQLGAVAMQAGEELDVALDGQPVVWEPIREHPVHLASSDLDRNEATVELVASPSADVAVLEVRNTSAFEASMRNAVLHGERMPTGSTLDVHGDRGRVARIRPTGTKFLRRVVVPLPRQAKSLTLRAREGFWYIRRLWIGERCPGRAVAWLDPIGLSGVDASLRSLLREGDGQRLCLMPADEVVLDFRSAPSPADRRIGYVLRARGYYDLVPDALR